MSNSSPAAVMAKRLMDSHFYWETDAGRALWEVQRACLGPVVEDRPGRHGLEMSMGPSLMGVSSLSHPIRWVPALSLATGPSSLVCPPDHLALPDRCMDVVIIHHWLEHLDAPHHTLQEAARVTADDGKLVLMGFNPLGLKGLYRKLRKRRSEFPYNGQWHKASRLRDWLTFVDFEVERVDYCCFRGAMKATCQESWEALGRRHNLPWGESYMIQAQRRQQAAPVKRVRFSLQAPVPSSSLGATRSSSAHAFPPGAGRPRTR
ncbi:methyltransferase domain-containing protein [Halomonas aquamarina]|uniref:Methyltransferase domain-containing protein n=1 Tax=Vreelandella aquamarina TaxID=77097 RepID=A0ACC5VVT6_9GAMM|nr:methyltransferase domain-containing protein [Halomonas aquamarina]MBZ5487819.1 methyltransferase domain-containing protein [Halomonas aquamarina]